jgi:Spy/CpxP family protein refolding chaperone
MSLSRLAVLAAAVVPAVMAYKKYQHNSDHYDKKFKDIKDSLYHSTCADLKVTKEQKDEIKSVLKAHKDAVSQEIKDILKPKQKDVVDKATS